jgi:acyl-CoA thioester hydrolase
LKANPAHLDDATTVRVRYAETDAMGWVYYANYLAYFEVGRTELIRRAWRPYRTLEDEGLKLPVVEAHCRYQRGARYDDVLTIQTRLTLPSVYRLRFDYEIRRGSAAELVAVGYTEHCFVSIDGKPVKIPVDLRAVLAS